MLLAVTPQYHAIAFEGRVQNDTSEYVHHLVLSAWSGTPDCGRSCDEWLTEFFFPSESESDSPDGGSAPSSPSGTTSSRSSSSPSSSSYIDYFAYLKDNNITIPDFCNYDVTDIFPWGIGSADVYLPDDVGFLFGNTSGGYTSVSLQTHYNNPNGDTGKTDSSGVRVYYTEELRPIEMGVSQPESSTRVWPVFHSFLRRLEKEASAHEETDC